MLRLGLRRFVLAAPEFRLVVVGRGLHVDGPFQIQPELFGADDRRALRSRAEYQTLQRGDLRAQVLVFAVESQHHLSEGGRVRGEIFRANRHAGKLPENAPNCQQNKAIQPTFVGRLVTLGTTRDHSERPSISIANCAPVTRIVPSPTGGQAKPPSSSHLVARCRFTLEPGLIELLVLDRPQTKRSTLR